MNRMRTGKIFVEGLVVLAVLAILVALLVPAISMTLQSARVAAMQARIGVPATPDTERIIEELVHQVEIPPVYTSLLPGQYTVKLRIPHERHHEVTGGMVQMALFRAGERWAVAHKLSIVKGSEHFVWSHAFCQFTFALEGRQ